jgi:hypothetical protein
MKRSWCCGKLPVLIDFEDVLAYFCGNKDCETFVFQYLPGADRKELARWWDLKCGRIEPRRSLDRLIKRADLPKRLHHEFEQLNFYEVDDLKNLKPMQVKRKFRLTMVQLARLWKTAGLNNA